MAWFRTGLPWGRALLNALLFFLIICSYYVAKPVRSSLILEWMGPTTMPYVYLFSAGITLLGVYLLEQILKKTLPRHFLPGALLGFAVLLVVCWMALTWFHAGPVLSFLFYLYIAFFGVVSVALFWSGCNDSFADVEGRALYGIIGMGGILGGMLGSDMARLLVRQFGTVNLVLISAGILLLAVPIPWVSIRARFGKKADGSAFVPDAAGFMLVLRNPYVLGIAGIVLCTTLLATLFDFQYQSLIKSAGMAKDERTEFIAGIMANSNRIALVVHLVLTPLLLRLGGPVAGLLPMPILMVGGSVLLSTDYDIGTAGMFWMVSSGMQYSLNQVAKESLYLPAPRSIKYQAKLYVDGFVYRFGDAIASLFLLLWTTLLQLGTRSLLQVNLLFALLWLVLVVGLYMKRDRKDLQT